MKPCNRCGYDYKPTTDCPECGTPMKYIRLNSLLTTFEADLNREPSKGGQQVGLPRIWQMVPSVKKEINWYIREIRKEIEELRPYCCDMLECPSHGFAVKEKED